MFTTKPGLPLAAGKRVTNERDEVLSRTGLAGGSEAVLCLFGPAEGV